MDKLYCVIMSPFILNFMSEGGTKFYKYLHDLMACSDTVGGVEKEYTAGLEYH